MIEVNLNSKNIIGSSNQKFVSFSGLMIILNSLLILSRNTLLFMIGHPPLVGSEYQTWITSNQVFIELIDEFDFFIAVFLIPISILIYNLYYKENRVKCTLISGMLMIITSLLVILSIILARLVYPVFGIIIINDTISEFILAIYFGGLHAISLLLGTALILLCSILKNHNYNKFFSYLGLITGTLLIVIEGYPWIFGSLIVFLTQILFTVWFVTYGYIILKNKNKLSVEL